eukprot:1192183-Prorocentrum_minimum.AAC.2
MASVVPFRIVGLSSSSSGSGARPSWRSESASPNWMQRVRSCGRAQCVVFQQQGGRDVVLTVSVTSIPLTRCCRSTASSRVRQPSTGGLSAPNAWLHRHADRQMECALAGSIKRTNERTNAYEPRRARTDITWRESCWIRAMSASKSGLRLAWFMLPKQGL